MYKYFITFYIFLSLFGVPGNSPPNLRKTSKKRKKRQKNTKNVKKRKNPYKPLFFRTFSKTAKNRSGVHGTFFPKNAFFPLFCLTPPDPGFWGFGPPPTPSGPGFGVLAQNLISLCIL